MALIDYLRSNDIGIEVIFPDDPGLLQYTYLERGDDGSPTCAFKPTSEEELQSVIQLLNEHKTSVVIFAGNTGLVSAQRAQQQAVIDINGLNKMLSITLRSGQTYQFNKPASNTSAEKQADIWQSELEHWLSESGLNANDCIDATIDCEAGLSVGSLNHILHHAYIEIPIDTGAISVGAGMTAGAGAANATHGGYGLMHGTMADLVVQARSINGNGTLRIDESTKKAITADPNKTVINSAKAQYGNSALGTQGTFAVISQLSLRTYPLPTQQHFFMVKTCSMEQTNEIRRALHRRYPQHLRQFELMNRQATDIVRTYEPDHFINPFYSEKGTPIGNNEPIDSDFVIMLELINSDEEYDLSMICFDFMAQELNIAEHNIAYAGTNGTDPESFINFRHHVSSASNRYANKLGGATTHRITPDISVPPRHLPAFSEQLAKTLKENNFTLCLFGHAGIGALHLHIFSEDALNHISKTGLTQMIFSIVNQFNGSCWSEHGIGTANADMYSTYTPQKHINEWLEYKKESDPLNILNPYSNSFNTLIDTQ